MCWAEVNKRFSGNSVMRADGCIGNYLNQFHHAPVFMCQDVAVQHELTCEIGKPAAHLEIPGATLVVAPTTTPSRAKPKTARDGDPGYGAFDDRLASRCQNFKTVNACSIRLGIQQPENCSRIHA